MAFSSSPFSPPAFSPLSFPVSTSGSVSARLITSPSPPSPSLSLSSYHSETDVKIFIALPGNICQSPLSYSVYSSYWTAAPSSGSSPSAGFSPSAGSPALSLRRSTSSTSSQVNSAGSSVLSSAGAAVNESSGTSSTSSTDVSPEGISSACDTSPACS